MFENYEFSHNLGELIHTGDWSAVQTYVEASLHVLFEYTLHVAFSALLS
jgi:hypothetical protein